jgi:predicted permease
MTGPFVSVFTATVFAISSIFVVIFGAGLMVRRKIISQSQIDALSNATVTIFLPCLIFTKVVDALDPSSQPWWWALPLAGIAMALSGTAMGTLVFAGQLKAKRHLLPLAGMQNAGYLVLPVGLALFPDRFDTFALYVFLFILGYNPVLWSLGKYLISGASDDRPLWRGLLTPPFVANIVAIVVALTGARTLLPQPVFEAVALIGSAAVPVATLVLGAVLGSVTIRFRSVFADAVRTLGVKLLLLPAVTALVVHLTGLSGTYPLLAEFLVIEAASAPPVGVVLMVRTYGGDEQRIGSLMVFSYAACVLTLPAWIAIWRMFGG